MIATILMKYLDIKEGGGGVNGIKNILLLVYLLFTYLCSDFETSPEFEELWKQIEKQEIEKQTPSFSK